MAHLRLVGGTDDRGEAPGPLGPGDLVPWHVNPQHKWAYPLMMLRVESRLREGLGNPETMQARLDRWKAMLARDDVVVDYDASTEDGFAYVPREDTDLDLIRSPVRRPTTRR
jgi:hypothetical protein